MAPVVLLDAERTGCEAEQHACGHRIERGSVDTPGSPDEPLAQPVGVATYGISVAAFGDGLLAVAEMTDHRRQVVERVTGSDVVDVEQPRDASTLHDDL